VIFREERTQSDNLSSTYLNLSLGHGKEQSRVSHWLQTERDPATSNKAANTMLVLTITALWKLWSKHNIPPASRQSLFLLKQDLCLVPAGDISLQHFRFTRPACDATNPPGEFRGFLILFEEVTQYHTGKSDMPASQFPDRRCEREMFCSRGWHSRLKVRFSGHNGGVSFDKIFGSCSTAQMDISKGRRGDVVRL
jgi:hypothetical protein